MDMGATARTGCVKDVIDGHYQHPNKDELDKEATALYHHQYTVSDSMKLVHPQTSKQQSDLLSAAVNTYFPSFGASTGWQLKSEYDDLPKDLMADLVRFFRPYNALLSGLLDDDSFEKEWTLDS